MTPQAITLLPPDQIWLYIEKPETEKNISTILYPSHKSKSMTDLKISSKTLSLLAQEIMTTNQKELEEIQTLLSRIERLQETNPVFLSSQDEDMEASITQGEQIGEIFSFIQLKMASIERRNKAVTRAFVSSAPCQGSTSEMSQQGKPIQKPEKNGWSWRVSILILAWGLVLGLLLYAKREIDFDSGHFRCNSPCNT